MRAAVLLLVLCHARAAGPFMPRRSTQPPHCPQGFRVVETGGPLKFRCVAERAGSVDKVLTAPEPEAGSRSEAAAEAPSQEYQSFRSPGLRADVPRGWARTDAWSDEVPTLFLELGGRRRGKPVSMTVSRFSPGQPEYEPLDAALAKEREYQGSRETAGRRVAGLPARLTLAGESRCAYVDAGGGVYYVLTYSAPKELFKTWEPAFERLLSSARFK
jgi:hypothetical protein